VRRGRVRGEFAVPSDPADAAALAAQARDVFRPAGRAGSAVPTHEVDELLLLSWWFRHRGAELGRTVGPTAVLAGCEADGAPEAAAAWWQARLAEASRVSSAAPDHASLGTLPGPAFGDYDDGQLG
jgi:hypothetical protein